MVDRKAEQKTGIRRLWEQIVGLFNWTKGQVRNNPLQSILVVALWLALCWLTWGAHRSGNLGFDGKTVWEWLDLLVVPVIVAIVAWWLRKSLKDTEQEIAEKNREEDRAIADDKRNQATLEAYLDRMTDLLLEEGLSESQKGDEVRSIARARTLAVLRSLDGKRTGHVVQFLHESGLIGLEPVVELLKANLGGANLSRADLRGACLGGVNLREANLRRADLSEANLTWADLSEANLSRAILHRAVIVMAHLGGADLREADLRKAIMPQANLGEANLRDAWLAEANLRGADLRAANLTHATLKRANLRRADLSAANLTWADLSEANLSRATVTSEQLAQAKSLAGTTLPDGTELSEYDWQAEFEGWRRKQEAERETGRDEGEGDKRDDDEDRGGEDDD